jgi:hypothetical protein
MRAALRLTLLTLVASAGLPACGGSWPIPRVMGEEELLAHLLPRGDERLVVANFWASW